MRTMRTLFESPNSSANPYPTAHVVLSFWHWFAGPHSAGWLSFVGFMTLWWRCNSNSMIVGNANVIMPNPNPNPNPLVKPKESRKWWWANGNTKCSPHCHTAAEPIAFRRNSGSEQKKAQKAQEGESGFRYHNGLSTKCTPVWGTKPLLAPKLMTCNQNKPWTSQGNTNLITKNGSKLDYALSKACTDIYSC